MEAKKEDAVGEVSRKKGLRRKGENTNTNKSHLTAIFDGILELHDTDHSAEPSFRKPDRTFIQGNVKTVNQSRKY